MSHSLIDLLNILSSSFKRNFANLQKKRTLRHPFERVTTAYQVYTWAAPVLEHNIDALRAEDAFSSKLGYEEHIPGQTRDWNEELQTTRELPRKTITERLLRERAIFKVHSDFVAAATRGAISVIDGYVMAINPGESSKMQMFIWNNLFFSLGFDVRDHYIEYGGDAAAHAAPKNDIHGVRVFNAVDLEGLHTLATAVIDYRGYRVTAQSIIPGILEKEQEQSVVYGSIDFGKTIVTHEKYVDLLQKAAVQLKILPHKVLNDKKEVIELYSSIECKGIIGNDGRHYILDLIRTFPPDVNFLQLDDVELCQESQKMNFPIVHKHKLGILRQELIDAFVENRYMMFLKYAALHLQQLSIKKPENEEKPKLEDVNSDKEKDSENEKEKDNENEKEKERDNKNIEEEEAKKMVKTVTENIAAEKQVEENTKDIIRKAATAVGSLKDADFDIRFNPDLFSVGVEHADPSGERIKREKRLVVEAADFVIKSQIPSLIHDLADQTASPIDSATLSEALHSRGINIRYLGKIVDLLEKLQDMKYIHTIFVCDIITRATKHIFREYIQNAENITLSMAISHFLNCYLSSCTNPHSSPKNDELIFKRKRKKHPFSNNVSEWASLTPKSLWNQIKNELSSYYDWKLPTDSIDSTVEKYNIQKISLLRSFCLSCGVQILLRDYSFDSRNQETFKDEDIVNLFPNVKHINPRASDAFNLYTEGQTKIQQGLLKIGYDLINEALTLLNNVYGPLHPEIAQCQRMLARLNYIMGDYVEAMAFQQRATLMSERVNGIDHPYTVTEYTHLALYCFANQQVSVALKLLYRARYLLLIIHGEIHPEVAIVDANIGLILHAIGQYSLSLQFLESFLQLQITFYGEKSLKVALSYHLVARTQSCIGDFRGALKNEKETFTIYKSVLGPEHEKTKEADECLRHLTQQAVVMAKKINEAFNGRVCNGLPPIQIQPPSMSSVMDLLNIINGIKYVAITTAEIERVRLELEKGNYKKVCEKEKTSPAKNAAICPSPSSDTKSDASSETSEPKTDESELKSEDDDDPTSR